MELLIQEGVVAYKEYYDALSSDKLSSLYAFYGSEGFIMKSMIDLTVSKFVAQGFEDMDYCEISGKNLSFSDAKNTLNTYPFMSERRVVVIDKPDFIDTEKWGKPKIDEFINLALSNNSVIVILIFDTIDKKRYGTKQLQKKGALIEFSRINDSELNSWLLKRFKLKSKRPSKSALDYLVQNSGYNREGEQKMDLYALENLITLICSTLDDAEVEVDDIRKYLSPLDNKVKVFKWIEAVLAPNPSLASELLYDLLRDENPYSVAAVFYTQVRKAFLYSLLRSAGKPRAEISEIMGIQDFVSRNLESLYRTYGLKGLNKILKLALELDERLKVGAAGTYLSFELFVHKIAAL